MKKVKLLMRFLKLYLKGKQVLRQDLQMDKIMAVYFNITSLHSSKEHILK